MIVAIIVATSLPCSTKGNVFSPLNRGSQEFSRRCFSVFSSRGVNALTHKPDRVYGGTKHSFRHLTYLHLKISLLNNPRKTSSGGWYMRTVHIKAHKKACSLQLLHKYIQGRGLNISGGLFCCCVLHSSLSVCAWCECLHESQTDFRNQKPYRICT